jgi:hypothetical protein
MSDAAWTISIDAATGTARPARPLQSSAASWVSTGRTRFEGASSVYAIDRWTWSPQSGTSRCSSASTVRWYSAK